MAKFDDIWPPPVYVAAFAGGETIRMSFSYSKKAKAPPFDAARKYVCEVIGEERARARREEPVSKQFAPAAEDIVSGHYERVSFEKARGLWLAHNNRPLCAHLPIGMRGTLIERGIATQQRRVVTVENDPYFAPSVPVVETPKRKRAAPKLVVDNSEALARAYAMIRDLVAIAELSSEVSEAFATDIQTARELAA